MLIFLTGLVVVAIWAATYAKADRVATQSASFRGFSASDPTPRNGAERIAQDRLARGEISTEEYERILAVLRQ